MPTMNQNPSWRPRNASSLTTLVGPPLQHFDSQPELATSGHTSSSKKSKGTLLNLIHRRFRPKVTASTIPRRAKDFGNRKAKFSNERTNIQWIKISMLLGGLAVTLLSFGDNGLTPLVGVGLLLVCLLTMVYSATVFQVRMEYLNMRREDVLYYDRYAPTFISISLMAVFALNVIIMYRGTFKANDNFFFLQGGR